MKDVIYAAVWFCLLVLPPGFVQYKMIGYLEAERIDKPRKRMRLHAWSSADANPANYTDNGEKLLVGFKLLQAIQVLSFVGWGIVFAL